MPKKEALYCGKKFSMVIKEKILGNLLKRTEKGYDFGHSMSSVSSVGNLVSGFSFLIIDFLAVCLYISAWHTCA